MNEEELFRAARPTLLNGIEDVIRRSDLANHAIFLTLEPIAEEQRRFRLWTSRASSSLPQQTVLTQNSLLSQIRRRELPDRALPINHDYLLRRPVWRELCVEWR